LDEIATPDTQARNDEKSATQKARPDYIYGKS